MSENQAVYNCIIVDDEPQNLLMLEHMINDFYNNEMSVSGTFDNARDALKHINTNLIDVIFLDVEMPGMNGFDLINAISESSDARIIIVSSHDKYALKAFRYSVFDYLQKPVELKDIRESINKLRRQNVIPLAEDSGVFDNLLVVNRQDKTIFIDISQITRMEAFGSYTDIYLEDGSKISTTKKMNYYETVLQKHPFYKLHRSHLVNMHKIRELIKNEGEGMVVLNDGSKIEISRAKKDEFVRMLLKFRKG